MRRNTLTLLLVAAVASLVAIVPSLIYSSCMARRQAELARAQQQVFHEDTIAFQQYVNARQHPAQFDGWYSLGWDGGRLPPRYRVDAERILSAN